MPDPAPFLESCHPVLEHRQSRPPGEGLDYAAGQVIRSLMQNPVTGLGLFSLFGITPRNREWIAGHMSHRLGISPTVIPYSNGGSCFYYSTHGEVQETDESVYLKLGFLRSPDGAPLTIDANSERTLNPRDYQNGSISGNGYLIRFHRLEPRFAIFMTFMATSQVYYVPWEGGVLCSTDLRVLLRLTDGIGVNEEAVPLHLMFRILPGPMTYFKDVSRMFPGEIITWHDNALEIRHSRDMYSPAEKPAYDHLDSTVYEEYFEKLSAIMRSYVREIERRKGRIANELSGGVDSSLIQLLIRQQASGDEASSSFSFTFEPEGFQFEVGYARLASELLGTRHTFVDVQNRDYADLLIKTIQTLAQPMVMAENDPGHLVLAEHIAANHPELDYVFMGQGADVLHGVDFALEVAGLDRYKSIPGRYGLEELYRLFGSTVYRKKLGGLPDVLRYAFRPDTYRCLRPPANLLDPVNRVAVPYTSFETVRHFLGDQAVVDALEYRRSLTESVMTSHTLLERVHDVDLVSSGYGPATVFQALFAAANRELLPFYLDQDVIRLVRSVSPEVRYIRNGEAKPILKSILRHKSLEGLVHKRKGSSGFWRDFRSWMMTGSLREMVHSIERPGCIKQKDFERLINNEHPFGYDLVWPLLTYDIFRKHVVRQHHPGSVPRV